MAGGPLHRVFRLTGAADVSNGQAKGGALAQLVMINGVLRPREGQVISVFDRGFLYGDSVFETIRTYRGLPFALSLHLERLQRSAGRVYMAVPATMDVVEAEVRQCLAASGNSESYIRLMWTRGEGPLGLDPSLAVNSSRLVIVTPLQAPAAAQYQSGIAVASYRTQRATDSTEATGAKVGNYLVSVLAMHHAKQQGAAEALIVDAGGGVVEGATSNIFAIVGSDLVTPPVEAGILDGITRRYLLEIASREGLTPKLSVLPLEQLMRADEVFVSSSIREVMPVSQIDGVAVGEGRAGPRTLKLLAAFRKRALAEC